MIQLLGYVGLGFIMMASVPQAIKTVKQGHSDGLSATYIMSLITGFSLLIVYLCLSKLLIPIFINYTVNLISYSIIAYYKFFPRKRTPLNDF